MDLSVYLNDNNASLTVHVECNFAPMSHAKTCGRMHSYNSISIGANSYVDRVDRYNFKITCSSVCFTSIIVQICRFNKETQVFINGKNWKISQTHMA